MGLGCGLMVVGGGSDGSMAGDCGPMGMGHGSDGPMVMVEVQHGSWITNLLGGYGCHGGTVTCGGGGVVATMVVMASGAVVGVVEEVVGWLL
ncbi:hypothetical protein SO802_016402 [Lithocarpus litseifolius]|uniref:Uncharacterized protein n=1 Tax=Lithocarpus litseifolius TaxID=425828 RepID=A0AAW2CX43_9ROSI